ncbi:MULTISPECIES: radical SAM family heme chaperone HemW [unclassified Tolypothrix]|uniref:radical SAM family heme chaperone HemW n=1 Tax=unclassified Tolypothrix TaxID=2649714 RepID=UPI0005F7A7B5|nr:MULTISPECIES: radical SAM family heme chaperone HemW [unclassified Tolypothrix]MBE9082700.1 coproporphyrinogen III oxidase [Tolypothrix sp. LEGE 11397]UYD25920.1 coproporphyrinogen III oxidase [Tolypothrix sp. PCC 7712]UYD31841.1 coproporphyrinogen III oxidase [Tolypothrix sp. PCC 7601]BAY91920.1 putative oxygen-independent coproporphyrinogen III oxidase [Microchaete diplosiphon NIES-3275]
MPQKVNFYSTPTSAYVHIPFCRRRCFYCDFPISVVGDRLRGETSNAISQYVEVLTQEIPTAPRFGEPLKTIFFGGGTPSLLSIEQLQQILTALEQHFGILPGSEISMEIDPGTFDLAHIAGYRSLGVNRVSLGIQAFQEELLKLAGRSHSIADIFAAVELVRKVEIPELSLDLISGLPHQSLEQWQDSLAKAVAIAPTHISIYDLTIEPGTAFGRYYEPGANPLPTDETTVKMYQMAQQTLTDAGYEHYEISNYAQPGHQCQHNRVYWENRPYYGFGMGAASYIEGKRFTRPRKTKEYYAWVKAGCVVDCEITPPNEVLLETLMLGLRLAKGVSLAALAADFGEDKLEELQKFLQPYLIKGWVEVINERLRLTDPQGFLFSNVVLADLFSKFGE